MPTAELTRYVRFSAGHRYHRPEWDDTRNRAVFGACANPHGHGHNYRLEVTVRGPIDPVTGFCVDLAALDDVLAREVVGVLDHRNINLDVPEFGEGALTPTSENLLVWLWPRLEAAVPQGAALVRMRLAEDETFHVDYAGPDA